MNWGRGRITLEESPGTGHPEELVLTSIMNWGAFEWVGTAPDMNFGGHAITNAMFYGNGAGLENVSDVIAREGVISNAANVLAETSNRTDADAALSADIEAEAAARENGDSALQADVDTRATKTDLSTETSERTTQDGSLQTQIDSLPTQAESDARYAQLNGTNTLGDTTIDGSLTISGKTISGVLIVAE